MKTQVKDIKVSFAFGEKTHDITVKFRQLTNERVKVTAQVDGYVSFSRSSEEQAAICEYIAKIARPDPFFESAGFERKAGIQLSFASVAHTTLYQAEKYIKECIERA